MDSQISTQGQTSVIYVRKIIKLPQCNNPTLQDIIYLKNQKCVVMMKHLLVLIDLRTNLKSQSQTEIMAIKTPLIALFPHQDGFLTVDKDRVCIRFDQKLKQTNSTLFSQKHHIKYSCQLGKSYRQYRNYETRTRSLDEVDDHPRVITKIQNSIQMIDDKYQTTTSHIGDYFTTYNIEKNTERIIQFPSNSKVDSFYQINQTSALCLRKIDNKVELIEVTFGNAGKVKHLKNAPQLGNYAFLGTFNKTLSLVLIYNSSKVWIYNYKKELTIKEFSPGCPSVSKRLSFDFKNFVNIQKSQQGVMEAVHYKAVSIKSLLMHIFKKSELQGLYYGDTIFRYILRGLGKA